MERAVAGSRQRVETGAHSPQQTPDSSQMGSMAPSPSTSFTPLTLRTLGDAGVYHEDAPLPLLGPGKPFALLVYLALTPGRRTSREFLLDLLWADLDPERARRALRQTLFHLRRLLGEEALTGTEELTLTGAIDTDRDRFLRELERGDPQTAVALYGGNFLPAFGVPGGASFEHWADLERDRLQTAFLRSADILVRRLLNESHFKEAQRLARRIRELVPENERAWRLVLETTVAGQDLVAAAVEAKALEGWAEREEIALESSTRLLLARARGLAPSREGGANGSELIAELTGREREFSTITSAWEGCRNGRARHLHLTAPAGFGKSRLLRDACSRLAASGARVVRVQGTPGDREVPYAFAADLAWAIATLPGSAGVAPSSAATLVALNPALSSQFAALADTAQGEEALRRRLHAMADLVQSVAHEQPFVLAIDDLHWIDRLSYRILEGLFSRFDTAHLLCLTAARPERIPAAEGCVTLRLAALSREQISSLVSALGSLPEQEPWSAHFIAGLQQATGARPARHGNPSVSPSIRGVLTLDHNEWRCLGAGVAAVAPPGGRSAPRAGAGAATGAAMAARAALHGWHVDRQRIARAGRRIFSGGDCRSPRSTRASGVGHQRRGTMEHRARRNRRSVSSGADRRAAACGPPLHRRIPRGHGRRGCRYPAAGGTPFSDRRRRQHGAAAAPSLCARGP
ncbi:MAG: AAA family ATPase [Gemmatimonadaceae bacterium]|nr:AAA family ATPase [Gemmatimonadaceae bacterium]